MRVIRVQSHFHVTKDDVHEGQRPPRGLSPGVEVNRRQILIIDLPP